MGGGDGGGDGGGMARMAKMARIAMDDEGSWRDDEGDGEDSGGMYGACMEPARSARSVYGDWYYGRRIKHEPAEPQRRKGHSAPPAL